MYNIFKRKIKNLIFDKKFSEILTGSAWALSARVIGAFLAMLTSVIVARLYGADVLGVVAVVNSFLVLATIFTVLGTGTSILRLIPEHLAKYSPTSAFRLYRKTQTIVTGISLVTGGVFFICAGLIADKMFSKPHLSFYFATASAFVVFKSLMALNTEAVRGLRLIKCFALMQVLPQSFNLAILVSLGLIWPVKDVPVYALLGSFGLTAIIGWIIMEYAFRKIMQPNDKVHPISGRSILSTSWPMLLSSTMTFVIGQTGVIMLGMFRSDAEVGYYAIAVKLATLTTYILSAVNSMAGPKFSELFYSNKLEELFYVAKKATKLIFWTTTPILLILVFLGRPLIGLLYGLDFQVAYLPVVLLASGQFCGSIAGATSTFLNMTGHQKILRNTMVITALFNIALNVILIPEFGVKGAALAAMCSMILKNAYTVFYIKKKYGYNLGYWPMPNV